MSLHFTVNRRAVSVYLPATRYTYALALGAFRPDYGGVTLNAMRADFTKHPAGPIWARAWSVNLGRHDGGHRCWKVAIG